jgi:hypothetical protein
MNVTFAIGLWFETEDHSLTFVLIINIFYSAFVQAEGILMPDTAQRYRCAQPNLKI